MGDIWLHKRDGYVFIHSMSLPLYQVVGWGGKEPGVSQTWPKQPKGAQSLVGEAGQWTHDFRVTGATAEVQIKNRSHCNPRRLLGGGDIGTLKHEQGKTLWLNGKGSAQHSQALKYSGSLPGSRSCLQCLIHISLLNLISPITTGTAIMPI